MFRQKDDVLSKVKEKILEVRYGGEMGDMRHETGDMRREHVWGSLLVV